MSNMHTLGLFFISEDKVTQNYILNVHCQTKCMLSLVCCSLYIIVVRRRFSVCSGGL